MSANHCKLAEMEVLVLFIWLTLANYIYICNLADALIQRDSACDTGANVDVT